MQIEIDVSTTQVNLEKLKEIVDKNLEYLSDKYRMVSEYRREKEINNDYKGRQLLELIQNADDAGSSYVKISVNRNNKTLSISNGGEPFTLGGFRSLTITNLSTKRKKKYIGNKGLGFRSILNWSNQVTIISAGVKVTFSKAQAKNLFYTLYPDELVRNEINEEFEYEDNLVPFPLFSVPKVEAFNNYSTDTTIEIEFYEESEKEILYQLQTLSKEVLLFLNHIREIELVIDGVPTSYNSTRQGDAISIGDKSWEVFDNKINGEDPILPARYKSEDVKEIESYSLKIAVQKDLSDSVNKLFTYFPTKIGLDFPMIIHGTFELDSSRNRIIETEKNKFLVNELISLIFKVSDRFFGDLATWDRLRLLNYKGNKDTVLNEFGFYTTIDNKIKSLPVFPCMDGRYRPYSQIKFHSNLFSELIEELGQLKHFGDMLKRIPDDLSSFLKEKFPNLSFEKKYSDSILRSKAETVSREIYKLVSTNTYAKWVATLGNNFLLKVQPTSILYNEQGELIESNNTIFTPPSKNALIEVPEHVKIDYINTNLFDKLVGLYKLSDDNERARKLKDKLDNFVNIQSFEPAPVLTKIVTNTNQVIGETEDIEMKKGYVRAMIGSLYNYYNFSSRAKESQIRTDNVPVLNVLGEIIYAKDSFLSESYAGGLLRQKLLGSLYSAEDLIGSAEDLGLRGDIDIETFLVDFLGVNKFLKLERLEERTSFDHNYLAFVFLHKNKPDRFRGARISYTFISNLGLVEQKIKDNVLSREQIITWICMDTDVKEKLHSLSDTELKYDLINQNHNSFPYRLNEVPSFIRYQLSKLELFDDFLLNDQGIPVINKFQFDFRAECFISNGIDSTIVKETLIQLGAKTEFNNLRIDTIENILKSLPIKDSHGKYARKIYQSAIERFKERKEYLKNLDGLQLHASKEKTKLYVPYSEVYYANTIGLPRKILNERALLNYQKRSGEYNISDFFKVQTFDDIVYTAEVYQSNEYSTIELSSHLKQIRPLILVHRLQRLKSDSDIREAIKIVKSLNIVLCSDLTYNFNGSKYEAEDYDFVPLSDDKYSYLVKYTKSSTIDILKKDSELSDVVSEIYSIAFDLANIRGEVRSIFRNEIKDTLHQIIDEFGEESLLNAKSKLEITNAEFSFWKFIYQLKEIEDSLPLVEDENDFRKSISDTLQIERRIISQIDYDFLGWSNNLPYLVQIFSITQISVASFNKISGLQLNLYEYHSDCLQKILENIKQSFIDSLWNKLKEETTDQKKELIFQTKTFVSSISHFISDQYKYEIEVLYNDEIAKAIKNKFDLLIDFEANNSNLFISQFETNKKGLDLNDEQINSLSDEDRSLLYFKLDEETLNKIKSKIKTSEADKENEPSNDFECEVEIENDLKEISGLEPSRNGKKPPIQKGKRRKYSQSNKGGTYNPNDDKARAELGKQSEEEVLKALLDIYTDVVWVSGNSNHPEKGDHWGYDIKYRVNKDSEWQFVEVKSFYKGSFYFTSTELETAKEYSDRYFLYLVTETGISTLLFQELLTEDGEINYDNKYFEIEIKDYKFFKI